MVPATHSLFLREYQDHGLPLHPTYSEANQGTLLQDIYRCNDAHFHQAIPLLPSRLYCHCERSEAISLCIFKLKSSLVIFLHALTLLTLLLLNTVLLWLFLYYSEFRSFSVVISPAKPPEPYPTAHQRRSRRVVPRCLPPQHPVQCRHR